MRLPGSGAARVMSLTILGQGLCVFQLSVPHRPRLRVYEEANTTLSLSK